MVAMEIGEHIAALAHQGTKLANAARCAGYSAVVPTCTPWRMRDLLRHVGYVHRWATQYVAGEIIDMMPELTEADQLISGPGDETLHDWFMDGLLGLVEALADASPDMRAWTFLPAPSPLAFWARRQAHETAIHSADAQLAAGFRHTYQADFAADGIDELLIGFFGRDAATPSPDVELSSGRTLLVRTADTGQDWHVRLTEDGTKIITTARGSCPADSAACILTGPASELYLLLWNRVEPAAAEVTVSGDEQLLHAWRDSMRVTW
jgi:uncharacterized protein (TIGR03083 family)